MKSKAIDRIRTSRLWREEGREGGKEGGIDKREKG